MPAPIAPDTPVADAPALPAAAPAALLAQGRLLLQAAQNGAPQPLLRGRRLALLCPLPADASALLFCRAAQALGADVALIGPDLGRADNAQALQSAARLIGRLYDAMECQGLPAELVQRIGQAAGIPVFDGLASPQHASAAWAALIEGEAGPEAKRCAAVQAVLLAQLA